MFNKERFHNALALSLGYERIIRDKRIIIEVEDSDDPWVTLKLTYRPEVVRFKASDNADALAEGATEMHEEIQLIVDAVRQAYGESCNRPF